MRFKHKTLLLVLPVLLLAFAFTGCDDSSSNNPQNPGGSTNPQDDLVSSISLSVADTDLSGPFGSTETVSIEVTARNSAGEAVEGASVSFNPAPAMGKVSFVDGNTTNASGKVSATYELTYTQDGSAVVTAAIGGTSKEVEFDIDSRDVRITASANTEDDVVVAGAEATSDITIRVLDAETNQAVAGVPVNLEITNGADAILSTPSFNEANNSFSSNLTATIPDTVTGLTVDLRAYIDLPPGVSINSVGKRVMLPIVKPGDSAPTMDSESGDDSGNDTPMIDSQRPLTGKGAAELQTWQAGEGPGDKGTAPSIAEVVMETSLSVEWTTWGSGASLNVRVVPGTLKVLPDSVGTATVTVTASNNENAGIQGLQTYLTLVPTVPGDNVGTLSLPDVTGANGVTTSTLTTNGYYGTWEIEARVSPGDDPATTTITVEEGSNVSNAYLAVEPTTLFVEPTVSGQATVTAIAYDTNNNAVPEYNLFMRLTDQSGAPVGGTIAPPDTTNGSGLTTTTINTNGAYGDWVVEVYAYQNADEPLATTNFSVQEGSSIASITMNVNPTSIKAEPGANKQIAVRATAKDEQNNGLRNRQVYFSLRNPDNPGAIGSITASDTTDSSGVTTATINTDGETGEWVVEARAYPSQPNPMVSKNVSVVEGSDVTEITINVSPDILTPAPETSDTANVYLIARNENGAGVQDAELHLNMRNLIPGQPTGSISQPDSTGPNGGTVSELLTAGRYGTWIIEASPYAGSNLVFRDTVQVLEGSASYISAAVDTNKIAVRGTNGLEQTALDATIYDENDVPLQDGSTVYFLAEQFPWSDGDDYRFQINDNNGQFTPDTFDGMDLTDPRTDLFNLPFDSATVNNGVATVTLRSGSQTGPVRMFIWSKDADDVMVSSIFNGVSIVAGPPALIEAGFRRTGYQAGSGVWDIEIDARIADARDNEVLPGYEVWFTVDPDFATAWNQGVFTGNESQYTNVVTPGVAYSVLSYHGEFTNQEITVTAHVLDADGQEITDDIEFPLPLQEPVGILSVVPTAYYFGLNDNEPGVFRLRLDVLDGYGTPVNDQVVQFNPDRGEIFKHQDDDPEVDEPWYFGKTGPNDHPSGTDDPPVDPDGQSIRWLIFTLDTAFPVDTEPYISVNVGATILGAVDATVEPETVWLYR